MTKRTLLLPLLLLVALLARAQGLAVQSFEELPTDLTANTPGTIVNDPNNGRKCALIKVETTERDFSFDTGLVSVVKTEQRVGEIWVYVPEGVKRISIFHPQLGVLRDKDLGQALRGGHTYLLRLVAGRVETVVRQSRTSQYVVFQVEPRTAVVFLDGEMLTTTDGTASKLMRFGSYDYRVQAPDYLPEAGRVTVSDPKQKHVVTVSLKPNFAQVTLSVAGNAEIWVNGQRKGAGQWTGKLGAGTYEIETRLPGHRPATTTRDIVAGAQPLTLQLDAPTPIYGEADINSTPAMADIYIDGKRVGQTPQLVSDLLVGSHQLRLSRQGYQDYTTTINILEGEATSHAATLTRQASTAPAGGSQGGNTQGDQRLSYTVGNVTFQMVRVDGGTFQMGATSEQKNPLSGEKPVHNVTLSTYYIGETEVTQALWEAVMGSNPSYNEGANKPVEHVSWNDCQEFVRRLNQKTGGSFRLPTEAEWEYAARGGSKSHRYQYSGSNTLDDVAWYRDNSGGHTHDVKTKRPNELGIYDMSGNASEWCQDWYGSYNSSAQINPKGPESGSYRVGRGSCCYDSGSDCRVTRRSSNSPSYTYYSFLSLRLASQ